MEMTFNFDEKFITSTTTLDGDVLLITNYSVYYVSDRKLVRLYVSNSRRIDD